MVLVGMVAAAAAAAAADEIGRRPSTQELMTIIYFLVQYNIE